MPHETHPRFAFISVDYGQVRIGFEWDVLLADPAGLLEGMGSQVRYVAVHSAAGLSRPALTVLLQEAAAIVPPPRKRARSV